MEKRAFNCKEATTGRMEPQVSCAPQHHFNENKVVHKFPKLPLDFKDTTGFKNLLNGFNKHQVLHLYGERMCGKTYSVIGLLRHNARSMLNPHGVVWLFDCKQNGFEIRNELKEMVNEMKRKKLIADQDAERLFDNMNSLHVKFLRLVKTLKMNVVVAFENVDTKHCSLVQDIIMETLEINKALTSSLIKLIVTSFSRDDIFDQSVVADVEEFCQRKVKIFSIHEAVKYLQVNMPDFIPIGFKAINQKLEPLYTEVSAVDLARHLHCNPGSLKAVKKYCWDRHVGYKQYLLSVNESPSWDFIIRQEIASLMKVDLQAAKAFMALHDVTNVLELTSCVSFLQDNEQRHKVIMNVLSCVHHEDIPIHFIGKICQYLRPNSKKLTTSENFLMNLNETCDFIYRMEVENRIEDPSSMNYPNGVISFSTDVFKHRRDAGDHLVIALTVMARMASKDNTETSSNDRLLRLQTHINALTGNVHRYLLNNFNAADKKKETFIIAMLVCRLFELLGHATNRDEIEKTWQYVLEKLIQAAYLVWEVSSACRSSKISLLFYGFVPTPKIDALEYVKDKDPEKWGCYIANKCIESGRKVDPEAMMEYWQSFISFNEKNLADFVQNTMKTCGISKEAAKNKLRSIGVLVEQQHPCQASHIALLRETGNLLTIEKLQGSFFAERLSSIFHTYGRQVRYLDDEIPVEDKEKCEYYSYLAHHIAKAVRLKTGVALLNEYISMANAIVPRMLQNRQNESPEKRKNRLVDVHRMSKELLDTEFQYYENACFRQVKDTANTKLNALRCVVKANTKMLKDETTLPPEDAYEDCITLLAVAKENSLISIAPYCTLYAARFLAATKRYEEAFGAFPDVFQVKHSESGRHTGILHMKDWTPNSFAWVVHNFCMAVDGYMKHEQTSQLSLDRKKQAHRYCVQVLAESSTSVKWRPRIEAWLQMFE